MGESKHNKVAQTKNEPELQAQYVIEVLQEQNAELQGATTTLRAIIKQIQAQFAEAQAEFIAERESLMLTISELRAQEDGAEAEA